MTKLSRATGLLLTLVVPLLTACEQGSLDRDPELGEVFVLEGATVYTSAAAQPIDDGVVVVVDGMIEAVGARGAVPLPASARRVSVAGLTLLPGLWNADVGLPDPLLALADTASDEQLEEALEERFTRFGFTTIVETSRDASELEPLRQRLVGPRDPTLAGDPEESGSEMDGVRGPRIVSVGSELPTGFARAAVEGETDPAARVTDLAERGFALIPGLARASYVGGDERPEVADERVQALIDGITRFLSLDGDLVFGTGAGYVPLYDPTSEYLYLDEAGVAPDAILAALTMNPALRFGHDYTGFIEPGMVADLILVDGDPLADPLSLTQVRWVMRDGIVLFNSLTGG